MAECYFCGRRQPHLRVVEEGWTPGFWRPGGEYVDCEVCPSCAAGLLVPGSDDELVVTPADPPIAAPVRAVAARFFGFPLETRGADALDFHEVSVWQLRDALTAAYLAGRAAK